MCREQNYFELKQDPRPLSLIKTNIDTLHTFCRAEPFQEMQWSHSEYYQPTRPTHDRLANRHGLVFASGLEGPSLFSVATNCSHAARLVLALPRS